MNAVIDGYTLRRETRRLVLHHIATGTNVGEIILDTQRNFSYRTFTIYSAEHAYFRRIMLQLVAAYSLEDVE
jgi:hypothetical protein